MTTAERSIGNMSPIRRPQRIAVIPIEGEAVHVSALQIQYPNVPHWICRDSEGRHLSIPRDAHVLVPANRLRRRRFLSIARHPDQTRRGFTVCPFWATHVHKISGPGYRQVAVTIVLIRQYT